MPPSITEALKALGKRVLDAYILAPLLTALPPAALLLFAHDFVTSSRSVSGLVILVASALAGLLVVSAGFNVAHWQTSVVAFIWKISWPRPRRRSDERSTRPPLTPYINKVDTPPCTHISMN